MNTDKLERLDQLIRLKATGSPDDLAEKMQVTKRTVFNMINNLKELGCPVYFNKSKNSYCYEYPGKLTFRFEGLDKDQLKNITGGTSCIFFQSENFFHPTDVFLPRKTNQNYNFMQKDILTINEMGKLTGGTATTSISMPASNVIVVPDIPEIEFENKKNYTAIEGSNCYIVIDDRMVCTQDYTVQTTFLGIKIGKPKTVSGACSYKEMATSGFYKLEDLPCATCGGCS